MEATIMMFCEFSIRIMIMICFHNSESDANGYVFLKKKTHKKCYFKIRKINLLRLKLSKLSKLSNFC